MLTLKFIHNESLFKTVLSASRYTVSEGYPFTLIWVYSTLKEESPASFELSEDGDYYEVFIENSMGKTIDRYRARSKGVLPQ